MNTNKNNKKQINKILNLEDFSKNTIHSVLGIAKTSTQRTSLILLNRESEALKAYQLLQQLGYSSILFYPSWETLPYDRYSPSPNNIGDRIKFLYEIQQEKSKLIISSLDAILPKTCPKTYLDRHGFYIKVGTKINQKSFITRLTQAGFYATNQVNEKGQFCNKGSLLDFFPPSSKLPIRLDFFDDEIEQIRVFDSKTQLSLAKLDQVQVIPSKEVDLSEEGRTCFRQNMRSWLKKDAEKHSIYQKISNQTFAGGIEYYLSLFFDETANFFDYLPKEINLFVKKDYKAHLKNFLNRATTRCLQIESLSLNKPLPVDHVYLSLDFIVDKIEKIQLNNEDIIMNTHYQRFLSSDSPTSKLKKTNQLIKKGEKILIACSTEGQCELINTKLIKQLPILSYQNWHAQQVSIASLDNSAKIIQNDHNSYLISGSELLEHPSIEEKDNSTDLQLIIDDLSQLEIGDPVVHYEHGIGRYQGLKKGLIEGEDDEFILISYANNENLYIPVTSLDLITRYSNTSSVESAPLHSLNSNRWEKAKQKAREKIRDTAAELLDIYAKRKMAVGEKIKIDYKELHLFSMDFPFTPTTDQEKAFQQVYKDIESPQPMDRIICGDVGFGKTEVAMRAAFAAVSANKQVALLVPTTLLAEQHKNNFIERFSKYPIIIKAVSRFSTAKEQKQIITELKEGKVDIVIGTHRIIQKDVQFSKLGLIIIDEEHKFGVKQKETLKALRSNANILTLTATPIPRTLSMSLSGIRDLSIIASPPPKRTPIQTIFTEYDEAIIYEGIEREISRGGQIYFVHNDISSIKIIEKNLQTLFPNLKIYHAHGQMKESELEAIMLNFYNQHFDILVATTIIESGIDNPNTNTIFINRADKFGLAQLHQLRGRVGRSTHQAYAYLITPSYSAMTKDAQKRMDALASLKGSGIGFMLASQDLEIRGAGELLGDNQSGQMTEIGFSLYNEMLEETIDAMKNNRSLNFSPISEIEIDLGESALIPDDYIYDVHTRLIYYKKIANIHDEKELDQIHIEMIDQFGLLPKVTKNLFISTEIKQIAKQLRLNKIIINNDKITIKMAADHRLNNQELLKLIQENPLQYQAKGADKLIIYYENKDTLKTAEFIKDWLLKFS